MSQQKLKTSSDLEMKIRLLIMTIHKVRPWELHNYLSKFILSHLLRKVSDLSYSACHEKR